VIPTIVWTRRNPVFVSRDYVGKASAPEWGINLSAKNLPELGRYRLPHADGPLSGGLTAERVIGRLQDGCQVVAQAPAAGVCVRGQDLH
jgi:hypothetical protein